MSCCGVLCHIKNYIPLRQCMVIIVKWNNKPGNIMRVAPRQRIDTHTHTHTHTNKSTRTSRFSVSLGWSHFSCRQQDMDIFSSRRWLSCQQHLWLCCHRSVSKPLVRGWQTDRSSHKWLTGMSSCSDVAVHLICSFEMSSCRLIGKFFRLPLKLWGDGELHGLSSA